MTLYYVYLLYCMHCVWCGVWTGVLILILFNFTGEVESGLVWFGFGLVWSPSIDFCVALFNYEGDRFGL